MFWEMLGLCLVYSWADKSETKRKKKLEERQKQWLKENGYDRNKQFDIVWGARKNKEKAIEEAFGYPRDSRENIRMCTKWLRCKGITGFEEDIFERLCEKNGIKYFKDYYPPEEYRNIK